MVNKYAKYIRNITHVNAVILIIVVCQTVIPKIILQSKCKMIPSKFIKGNSSSLKNMTSHKLYKLIKYSFNVSLLSEVCPN